MTESQLVVRLSDREVIVEYDGAPMVGELGAGIPIQGRWLWSFDGSLSLVGSSRESGTDRLGAYSAQVLTYGDEDGPLIRQALKSYRRGPYLVVETTALRDLAGTALEDSFFHTTFNSPVILPVDGLSYLVYTWGLRGDEGTGMGGHFPDVAIAPDLPSLPESLRQADFSPNVDLHQTTQKPFAPLIAYDGRERTLVMSPLDHFLISPMRLIQTPRGVGIARGLHGAVDFIPAGTTTRTALVFGHGLVDTTLAWGDLLLAWSGKSRGKGRNSPLVRSLGFWNCYGGYYAELFRSTDADTLRQLSSHFREADLPVKYFGLDLWYPHDRVGFARNYRPDQAKYPQGLKAVAEETEIPFLLHLSAFDLVNDYLDTYDFKVDEGSSYPLDPQFYRDRAREFREWGAMGTWHDFLRTQLQNCRSLRENIGAADQWFDSLAQGMAQEGLEVMLCMPTIGHYLASTAYDNLIAVRTSTDYVNHQPGQVELLRDLEEYRSTFPPQRNLRQNLLLSLLAGALDLAPSYDVFITNQDHPEGFADPNAPREALIRALSAGIVGLGDKMGSVDREIVGKLAFPDGTLAQPDHSPYPVASTLQSDVPAFYTTTVVGDHRWTYIALFNLAEEDRSYSLDLTPLQEGQDGRIYDYLAGQAVAEPRLAGVLGRGEYRFLVIVPRVGGIHPLGFPEKYVTTSARQVKGITAGPAGVVIDLELPVGRSYALAVMGSRGLSAEGRGLKGLRVRQNGDLTYVHFDADEERCSLLLRG